MPIVEGKTHVNHIDGNKHNNNVSNLEWVTNSENINHAFETGLIRTGECVYGAKLTNLDVITIRNIYIKGDSKYGAKPLARAFGVSNTTVRKIVTNRKWRYVNHD